ncbi:MAG: nucleotidyltransferase family protein [Terracidiphilus sp.]|jgi:NDP-sugar pyrophosphorylase family protein
MKAMVFAAGLGTRLRPLTNDRPKALVAIAGRTLLDITLSRLRTFGVREVILNVHHFADQVVAYLAANQNFGMRIEISREEVLLDTGGGLKKAAWFFLEPGADANEPFLIHNVDVLSTIDLARMAQFHAQHNALATLAVAERPTSRPLLFDAHGRLHGRGAAKKNEPAPNGSEPLPQTLAFAGIHMVSPRIFDQLDEEGAFPIIDAYVRLAAQGETILGFRADGAYWRDLGRPDDLIAAERDLASGRYPRG